MNAATPHQRKNIRIVTAHPEPRSLNVALTDFAVEELRAAGHEVRVSDLYAMKWKAGVDADDFPEQMAALEEEHRLVESVLAEAAAGTPRDADWPERLIRTLDLLRLHILKEQDGVFPAALAALSTEQWEAVEAVRARAGTRMEQPTG